MTDAVAHHTFRPVSFHVHLDGRKLVAAGRLQRNASLHVPSRIRTLGEQRRAIRRSGRGHVGVVERD